MMDRFNVWATMLVDRMQDLKDERGQTFVEYALILAAVVVTLLLAAVASGLGPAITTAITKITTQLTAP